MMEQANIIIKTNVVSFTFLECSRPWVVVGEKIEV